MAKVTKEMLDQRLLETYGGRVVLAGRMTRQVNRAIWYCHDCSNFFSQRMSALWYYRSNTRCKCPPMDPDRRFEYGDNMKSKGHMCMPEWETYHLEVPPRLVKES